MKNKKILVAAIIIISNLHNLALHAGGSKDIGIFEHRGEPNVIASQPPASWFEKHRNKILLTIGSVIAIGLGTYAWRASRSSRSSTENGNNNGSSLQKDYNKLHDEINALLAAEGTPVHKAYKAGIVERSNFLSPALEKINAGNINKDAIDKLQKLKLDLQHNLPYA